MTSRSVTNLLLGILFISFTFIGCAERQVKDPNSPWYRITTGSIVKLNQQLEIPVGSVRVFLQHGRAIRKSQLNHYYPNCNFEVRQLDSAPQYIDSGEFLITDVRWSKEQVVKWHGAQIASRFSGGFLSDDSASIYRYYHFRLESVDQPNLMRLTCRGGLEDRYQADLPSLDEIREALGDIVTITLAE